MSHFLRGVNRAPTRGFRRGAIHCAASQNLLAMEANVSMQIEYHHDRNIDIDQFIDVLQRSTLGLRRPVNDRACIADMLKHADILCTAWDGVTLVGVARSVTDFSYCCYLSDLAVDETYQHHGIGKELIRQTQQRLGALCKIILLAAPAATTYYPKIGFTAHHSAWLLASDQPLK